MGKNLTIEVKEIVNIGGIAERGECSNRNTPMGHVLE